MCCCIQLVGKFVFCHVSMSVVMMHDRETASLCGIKHCLDE